MRVEKLVCDECGKIQAAANHWHKIGVFTNGDKSIEIGHLYGPPSIPPTKSDDGSLQYAVTEYEVHDLCGEQCFYKHIGKLLKLNPAEGE